MQSKLKLLEQRIAKFEVENAKLKTEKAEIKARNAELLKQVMEKNAKRDVKNTELKSKVRKLEARLAILKQDNPVLADESVVNQQNSVNTKVIEDKKIDDYPEKPANVSYSIMTQLKRCKSDHEVNDVMLEVLASSMLSEEKKLDFFLDEVNKKKVSNEIRKRKRKKKLQDDFQKELDSEILIASLDSATSLNEKNGQGYSSIANEQVLNNQKITYNQKVEQDLRYELSAYMECKGQTEEVALQSDKAFNIEISEFSLEMILTGSSEVIAQNIVDLFNLTKLVLEFY
ncbi:hypothetical protein RhiirA5_427977 [Rhizophagus irregularis]|uniref:Uncharacterized protein n=2 Tax=Rhizophagus irregularis TaxID=588596 RepID=A0A2N0QSI9_9GLOM|nr:hypothetical protein RhiirA5_427977 [Rhizophagus irregularis]PKC54004.1 hypothetical protein RhiirA1_478155 [Rhizophagus irregularis]